MEVTPFLKEEDIRLIMLLCEMCVYNTILKCMYNEFRCTFDSLALVSCLLYNYFVHFQCEIE